MIEYVLIYKITKITRQSYINYINQHIIHTHVKIKIKQDNKRTLGLLIRFLK